MTTIMNLSTYTTLKKKQTLSGLYKRYDDITILHCVDLIETLYDNDIFLWTNPLTKKKIHKAGDISISFLSKCYYVWGDQIAMIGGVNLSYKEHIKQFIDKKYLFDVTKLRKSPPKVSSNSPPGAATNKPKSPPKVSSNSPPGAATNKPKSPPKVSSNSPPGAATNKPKNPPKVSSNSPPGAATNKPKSPPKVSSNSPPGAATNKPKNPPKVSSNSPPGAATNKPKSPPKVSSNSPPGASSSKKFIKFKSTNIKNINKNADKLTEDLCLQFVKYVKGKLSKVKTPSDLKFLTFINPITKKPLGIDSPILQSFLTKCYYSFNNKEVKSIIEELINVSDLMVDDSLKKTSTTPKLVKTVVSTKPNEIMVIEENIEKAIKDFYKCCDELVDNCHANGILKKHHYITNVVNSIMTIIHIKYVHLQTLYYGNIIKDNMPLQIYMYDDIFNNHLIRLGVDPKKTFIDNYNSKNIIYQQNDLQISNIKSELVPKHIGTYYMSNLYNRQYVFEYPNPLVYKNTAEFPLYYNMVNIKFLESKPYPVSLELAKGVFYSKIKPEIPFNYNITNSVLPKYIFSNYNNEVSKYFTDIIDLINVKLQTLPIIKGFSNEHTSKFNYFNSVINNMADNSYGNNETDYGDRDMIRKNILYSLNAQVQTYKRSKILYDEIYYNSKFTGTYPIFTWIPLSNHNWDSIYNYPNSVKWQPLGINDFEQNEIDRYYKNNGRGSFSADLNNTIYKVITGEYASINSLKDSQRPHLDIIVDEMKERVKKTIGIYKSKTRRQEHEYNNNKIYLYHGAKNRLHNLGGKHNEDIEILGFLSTTLNMYTASYYSGIAINNAGIIYIIEVDYTHTYINLNDKLMQFLLLPNSRIRVIYEFNFGKICVVLCKLIRTPSIETNNKLYNKMLDINNSAYSNVNKYVSYRIKTNNNDMPLCAFMLSKFWRTASINGKEDMEVYKIRRSNLNNKIINNMSLPKTNLGDMFIYFSLGQEYQLYVERGLSLISGNFEDIKYSIHQHFIKDCYKAIEIPCLDYIFIHSSFINNAITTGILLEEYKNNIIDHYKYDINNFLIDCIFKFNSINNTNKALDIIDERDKIEPGIYVDKIEGFRDAGLYCNGIINPLFNIYSDVGEHIQYIKQYQHLFIKYKIASDDDLKSHFKWCNNRIDKLIEIIKSIKDNYLIFINEKLIGKIKDTSIDKKGVLDQSSNESLQLKEMIGTLSNTLLTRCLFYKKCTSTDGIMPFIKIIRKVLSVSPINIYTSKLYENPIIEDLILYKEKQKSDSLLGGILSMKDIKKLNTQIKPDSNAIDHDKIYESFKNIPIQESKDMRKYKDMPKAFREYYKNAKLDKDGYFDISDHCHCRFV